MTGHAPEPSAEFQRAVRERARLGAKVTEKFKVSGKHKVKGVAKGGIVTLTMNAGAMASLLESGAIEELPEIVPERAPSKPEVKKDTSNA